MDETKVPRETSEVGAILRGSIAALADPVTWPVCGRCGAQFPVLIETEEGKVSICQGCAFEADERAKLEAERVRIMSRMGTWIDAWLLKAGLSAREIEARMDRIPEWIRAYLRIDAITSGIIPREGFGLRGEAGVGKTFALAALVRECATVRIGQLVPTVGRRAFTSWLGWVRWPEHANRMRVLASRDGGVEEADAITSTLAEMDLLVLDDLGAERWKADDWVASMLDLVVDARYNARRPIWWTTHLPREDFLDRYGQRLFSRLTGDNPMVEFKGRDLRIVK